MSDTALLIKKANKAGIIVPAFNVAHLPMTEAIIKAVRDTNSFALLEVSRPDWEKMGAQSFQAVYNEYKKYEDRNHVRLHLDHIPVIDEDNNLVDYRSIIEEALDLGYESVMIDASRLSLDDNIAKTREIAELAHAKDVPVEAELGAVLGHEAGPPPPYEELFQSGRGFTIPEEAERFARESECDWLSVAIGNIHGSVSDALKNQKKPEARLNLAHLEHLWKITDIPLVLHGGSGVQQKYVLEAAVRGITKINVGTEIRQAYELSLEKDGNVEKAQEAVYTRVSEMIQDYYKIPDTKDIIMAG